MAGNHATAFDGRLYRAALHLCPGEFRREHGDEMGSDFDDARREAASAGGAAVWTLRLLMSVDLGRTIVVQWLRTGLPVIGCVALCCSLALIAAFASVARRITVRIPADTIEAEVVGVVLLSAVAVLVIVATIVFNLWVHRPRRPARR
jgi:hypothetical protein